MNGLKLCLLTVAVALLQAGCSDLATEVAQEAADRQARQNETMAELQQEVAAGTRQLLESEAKGREQLLGAHQELQTERSRLQSWWQALYDTQRRESRLVAILPALGKLLLVVVVIGFCWYVLFASHRDVQTESELNDLLLTELTTERPQLSELKRQLEEPPDRLAFPPEELPDE